MGQALYRKYRSKSLSEIIGQEHITETLKEALKQDKLSHAYLFTGPRGTGKTSIARILAHEVNGLHYDHEDNHIDIIEIDAASNRGIDEIRDLREKVYSAPVAAKYKVYIIDEVHMLTTPAFNALLKTLEEPPEHVIFVLATTEAHKLPETIISRTQRHVFRPVPTAKVVKHLRTLADAEAIQIDDTALELIAEHGGGSFRDSISLLDQASSGGAKIDKAAAEQLLGIPPMELVDDVLKSLESGSSAGIITSLEQLKAGGYHPASIARQISEVLRRELIEGTPRFSYETQLQLLGNLLDVAPAGDPLRKLELSLLASAPIQSRPEPKRNQAVGPAVRDPEKPIKAAAKSAMTEPVIEGPATEIVHTVTPQPVTESIDDKESVAVSNAELDSDTWHAVLDSLKKTHNTLYGVVRMAVPEFQPGVLRLRFQFAFHQKRMNEAKHRSIIVDIIESITGHAVAIECLHDKEALVGGPVGSTHPKTDKQAVAAAPSPIATISNIFGSAELLES